MLIPVAIKVFMFLTILSNNKVHGGETEECHNPNKMMLLTYSRIG